MARREPKESTDLKTAIMDKGKAMATLRERMLQVDPLPDEPDFATSDETIVRFLKANDWKYKDAEKGLLQTIEYRRKTRPLNKDCKWCHERPGHHSMRQIGHDESGRPVIYSNFAQASTHKNNVEDIIAHVTYLVENAKATMATGVTTWVFVIDCTGMTLSACNPKLSYGMANILANHYPERLGLMVCVNHNPMFQGVWKALKKLLSPGTVSKVKLVRSERKIKQVFSTYFSDELSTWLLEEIALNKQKPLPQGQKEFWNPPKPPVTHDPRGTTSYIEEYVNSFTPDQGPFTPEQTKLHCPHPNVIDALGSKVKAVSLTPQEEAERALAMSDAGAVAAEVDLGEGMLDLEDDEGIMSSDTEDESPETSGNSGCIQKSKAENGVCR